MPRQRLWVLAIGLWALPVPVGASTEAPSTSMAMTPTGSVSLARGDRLQILVTGTIEGRPVDLTRRASLRSRAAEVVVVDGRGRITAQGRGTTQVIAVLGAARAELTVRVEAPDTPARPTFEHDIQPWLTRLVCNSGACHGKASGQNGFKLSLLGFDGNADHAAIARDAFGRRGWSGDPDRSLLLTKAAATVPHGGGPRLTVGSPEYKVLRDWIAAAMPRDSVAASTLAGISVLPTARSLRAGEEQQLAVTARYSDGATRDVTHLAAFQSSESAVVAVTEDGLIRAGTLPGEAAITARFEGSFASCEVAIPLPGEFPAAAAHWSRRNFIDDHVATKLRTLGITPSEPADDATFLRRVHLDVIGRLPTPDETRAFLADVAPDRRDRLVVALLRRPEYADHWASKWADLLRPNPYRVGIKAVYNLDGWLRDAFRRNMPYDQFARAVVAARGSSFTDGPAVVFRDRREPEEAATMMSQLFLGIRLDCAKCHHHPSEVWSQDDFYGFAAYFARVGRKGTGLSPPISGSEEIVFAGKKGVVKHPLTGKELPPKPLFGTAPRSPDPEADPRDALAAWMTAPDNPFFGRVIVNRVWAELMGRGIVDPVDDLRATNPPSNGPLLDALAADFRQHGYDLKHLIRTILDSHVYGLASTPTERNVADGRNFSRRYRRRLRAEVLLDAVCDITGVAESFEAAPPGTRAAALWTVRTESLFLDAFGRPDPNQDPPCERMTDTSVVQALHLMNAPKLQAKITSETGRVAQLARADQPPAAVVEELYLRAYCRPPTGAERVTALEFFAECGDDRRRAVEDLLWALLNSPEFVFED